MVTGIYATKIKTHEMTYRDFTPIEFEENGILFFVYPDGEFDFEILHPRNIDIDFNYRNAHISIEQNIPIIIERNQYGAISRIGAVFIDYNRYGKVCKIGSVAIYYKHGLICSIGNLNIQYHPRNTIQYFGYINDYHRYYTYHKYYKGHHTSYDQYNYKPYNPHYNNFEGRKKNKKHERDYKEIKHKKEVSYRDNYYETAPVKEPFESLKKRRPYSY